MKCTKLSFRNVPFPSCFTKSCSIYCFHMPADEDMRYRVKGCGLPVVGLQANIRFRNGRCQWQGRDAQRNQAWRNGVNVVKRTKAFS